ncbi:MAG: hypothetical protein FVQ85_03070 [Planctomycetes bacterium]|nr:hypothetical protein [Planctomycetota bacterium]
MTNQDETAPKRRRKLKVSYIIIVLLLIIAAGYLLFRFNLKSNLQSKLDAIRAAGYPATCAELDTWYTIPEFSENAADTIIEAFSYYYEWDKKYLKDLPIAGTAQLPVRTEPISEEMKSLIAEYLADNEKALELLHKSVAIKHCRYPTDFTQGPYTLIPHLSDIRKGVKMLKLEAILHAENAEPQMASDSVITIFGVARSLVKEPILISQLVRIACQSLAVSTLERILNRTKLTDEQLAEIGHTLLNIEDSNGMSRAFAGERCSVGEFLRNPDPHTLLLFDGPSPSTHVISLYKVAGLADADALSYIDLMTKGMEAMQLEPHKRKEAAEAAEAELGEIPKIRVLLRMVMPALSRYVTINLRCIAYLRTARAALAVQRYRLATGNLPHTLEELTPTYLAIIPKDPFDGKDLRYKKLDTGFVVYSVDEDGNDDGGLEKPPRNRRKGESYTYDITFIIQR